MIQDDFTQYLLDSGRGERTIRAYAQDLRHFFCWFQETNGEQPTLQTITPTDLKEFRQYMLITQKSKPATVNRRLAAIRVYLNWARETGQIDHDPARNVKGVDTSPLAPRWLDRRQQAAIVREAEKGVQVARTFVSTITAIRDHAILIVLMHTGLRVSELCALNFQDVTIRDRSGEIRVTAGKGQKARTVPLNKTARSALVDWIRTVREDARDDGANLFPVLPRTVERAIREFGRRANIAEPVTPHTLRHTFAKNLVDSGVSLDRVALLLGHSSLETTRIYTTPGMHDLEKAVSLLE